MKIYHNPRCSKSRQTLAIIRDAGIEPEIIEYLKTPPTAQELTQVLSLLGLDAAQILRTKESVYKELDIFSQDMSQEELIKLMVQHPALIERPIVVGRGKAVIGRPPENVNELL